MGCKLVDTKNENSNICNMFLKKGKKKCYIICCTQREVRLSGFTLIAKLNHKINRLILDKIFINFHYRYS